MNRWIFFLSLAAILTLPSQTEAQQQIYVPTKDPQMWSADTLFIGASFVRRLDIP